MKSSKYMVSIYCDKVYDFDYNLKTPPTMFISIRYTYVQ
jgi:hypothetical protein